MKRRFRGRKGLRKVGVEEEGCGDGWRCRGAAGGVSVFAREDATAGAALEGLSWLVVNFRS